MSIKVVDTIVENNDDLNYIYESLLQSWEEYFINKINKFINTKGEYNV